MIFGIREGKFFKGRLNISRDDPNEATVQVDGLTNDLLVLGLKNQNRGLSGDQVCLQILPEKDWPIHYKEVSPMNIVDKEIKNANDDAYDEQHPVHDREIDEAEEEARESKQKMNMMHKINAETERRVTAKVLGVIKTMNKTYGGSILSLQDMIPSTQQKLDLFLKNLNI